MSNGLRLLRGTRTQHTANSSIFKNGEITAVTTANGVSTGELRIHNENFLGGIPVGNMALTQTVLEGGRITHLREARTIVDLGTIQTRDIILQKGRDQIVVPANNVGIYKSDEITPILEETNDIATLKNITLDLSGQTNAILVPKGTTAQRPSSPVTGMIRYNTQLEQYELYDSVYGWVKIGDQPPEVTSISPTHISTTEVANTQSITITGTGFDSGTYVRLVPGNGNADIVPVSTTLVSGTELSITVNTSDLDSAEEPYDVRVVKASGLSTIAQDILYVDNKPVWSITPNETIKTVHAIFRSAVNIQLPTAVDPDGDVVTYAATNLPSGLTANSTTGLISGSLADVSSDTTYSPTVKALSTGSDPGATQIETTRTVNIVQKAGIGNSLRFDGTSYLSRTFGTATKNKKWTFSAWVKVSKHTGLSPLMEAFTGGTDQYHSIFLDSSGQFRTNMDTGGGGVIGVGSTGLLRDFSAWYHLILAYDTIDSSLNLNHRFYINGVDRTETTSISYTGNPYINSTNTHRIGFRWGTISTTYGQSLNGYLANIHFIDGQALSPSDFGEPVNGIWTPKTYLGTYGTNGFWLRFDDSSQIGKDSSGRGNHWTAI